MGTDHWNFRYGAQTPVRTKRAKRIFRGEQSMKRSDILLAFVAAGALAAGPALAKQSAHSEPNARSSLDSGGPQNMVQPHNMGCPHYMAMNAASCRQSVRST